MSTTPERTDEHVEPDLPLPEDFNLDDWISGVRAARRSCTIYAKPDVQAEIDDIERRLLLVQANDAGEYGLEDADGGPETLNARLDELYKELLDSAVTFIVEGRSADWLTAKEKEITRSAETHGLSKDEKTAAVTRHQLADAIIQPAGVTVEHLKHLDDVVGPQYRKLVAAFFTACSQAPVVSAPTSPSSSARRGGRGR